MNDLLLFDILEVIRNTIGYRLRGDKKWNQQLKILKENME